MPRKKQSEPELPPVSVMEQALDRMKSTILGPAIGDIIQVTAENHICFAFIGIVHSSNSGALVCYQPDKGRPRKFTVAQSCVEVVGKARLKWGQPLPNDSTDDRSYLDKI